MPVVVLRLCHGQSADSEVRAAGPSLSGPSQTPRERIYFCALAWFGLAALHFFLLLVKQVYYSGMNFGSNYEAVVETEKEVVETPAVKPALKKVLGLFELTMIGVSGSIGAGVFVLSGVAASRYAGPAVTLSYFIAGICSTFFCVSYAEMASMIQASGGAYSYTMAAFGRFVGWLVGWSLVAEYTFTVAAVSTCWSSAVVDLVAMSGAQFPPLVASAPFSFSDHSEMAATGSLFNLPAVLLICTCSLVVMLGTRETSWATTTILLVKLLTLLLFVALGLPRARAENWTPFIPPAEGFGRFGWAGVLRASSLLFFAYIGFDAVTTAAKESLRPAQDLPRAMLASLAVCAFVYCTVAATMTGLLPYPRLAAPDPLAVAAEAAGPDLAWLAVAIRAAVVVGLPSVAAVSLFAMASLPGPTPPVSSASWPYCWAGRVVCARARR